MVYGLKIGLKPACGWPLEPVGKNRGRKSLYSAIVAILGALECGSSYEWWRLHGVGEKS